MSDHKTNLTVIVPVLDDVFAASFQRVLLDKASYC